MRQLKIVKNAYTILTVCLIAVGIALLLRPQMALSVMCKVLGVYLIIYGIVKLYGYFAKDIFQLAFQFDLGLGIVSLIIGIVMLFKTEHILEILAILMGVFMLVDAALKVQTAMEAKKFGLDKWVLILIMAFIVAFVGILLLIMPFQTTGLIVRIIGLSMCLDGILNLLVVRSTVETIRRNDEWEE